MTIKKDEVDSEGERELVKKVEMSLNHGTLAEGEILVKRPVPCPWSCGVIGINNKPNINTNLWK